MPQAAAFVAAKATALFIAKTGVTSLIVAKAVYATAYVATTAAMIVGGNALARSLAPEIASPDRSVRVTVDSDEPVKIAVGRTAIAGSVKFTDTYDSNRRLGRVLTLSDWPSGSIVEIQMNRETVSPGAGGIVAAAPWKGKMTVQTRTGAWDQAAYGTLVSRSSYWTAAHRGRGITDAFWEIEDDDKVWANGFPDPLFVGDFALVYDVRKDSSRGGVGAHRIDDPRTYEYSSNIALIANQYVYGFRARADDGSLHLKLGMGVSADIINFASLAAAANRCDEIVGGKPRYFGGGLISAADDPADVLRALGAAMGGAVYQAGGLIEYRAAGPVPAEIVLTDDDLKGEVEFVTAPEFRDAVNILRVKFTDPAAGWKSNTTDPIKEQTFIDQDGEELEGEHAVYMAYDGDVAHRLGRLRLSDLREPRRISAPFKAKAAKITQGRTVIFRSARLGIDEKMFVEASALDRSGGRTLQLVTETDAKYAAADNFDQPLPVPPTADRYDPREVVTPDADDWAAAPLTIENGESKVPALAVTGGTDAAQVRRVKVEYRREGDTQWGEWEEAQAGASLRFEITGVAPDVAYEVAISYRNAAGVLGDRAVLGAVTTPNVHRVPEAAVADDAVIPSESIAAARDAINEARGYATELLDEANQTFAYAAGLGAEDAQLGAQLSLLNWLSDPLFETGVSGWDAFDGSLLPVSGNPRGLLAQWTFDGPGRPGGAALIWPEVRRVSQGRTIQLGVEIGVSGACSGVIAEAVFLDEGGAELEVITFNQGSAGRLQGFAVAPEGASECYVRLAPIADAQGLGGFVVRRPLVAFALSGQAEVDAFRPPENELVARIAELERVVGAAVQREKTLAVETRRGRAVARSNTEAIVTETEARVTDILALQADFNGLEEDVQTRATITFVNEAVASEAGARAASNAQIRAEYQSADAGLQNQIDARATITFVNEAVASEAGSRATAIANLEASFNAAISSLASITFVNDAIADEAQSRATSQQQLQAQIGDVDARVDVFSAAIADLDGRVSATWGFDLDANGNIQGVIAHNDGTTGLIRWTFDSFQIWNGTEGVAPFEVSGGVVRIRNVEIDGGWIKDATVGANKIPLRAITAPNVAPTTTFGPFAVGEYGQLGIVRGWQVQNLSCLLTDVIGGAKLLVNWDYKFSFQGKAAQFFTWHERLYLLRVSDSDPSYKQAYGLQEAMLTEQGAGNTNNDDISPTAINANIWISKPYGGSKTLTLPADAATVPYRVVLQLVLDRGDVPHSSGNQDGILNPNGNLQYEWASVDLSAVALMR